MAVNRNDLHAWGVTAPRRASSACKAATFFAAIAGLYAGIAGWPEGTYGSTDNPGQAAIAIAAAMSGLAIAGLYWIASVGLEWMSALYQLHERRVDTSNFPRGIGDVDGS